MALNNDDFVLLMREIGHWAAATFPGESMEEKLLHLREELDEIEQDSGDSEEWADGVILLFDAARIRGFGAAQVIEAVRRKFAKNKTRKWRRDADGVYRHVKDNGSE